MIRKVALQIGVPALLAVIACSAYLVISHVRKTQQTGVLISETSALHANISTFVTDITDMETSQRGYLLTGDEAYLELYREAKGKIAEDLARLRRGFIQRTHDEQSLESRLESLTGAKQSEMDRTIDLRERGYRHRAFKVVDTNEGKGCMDEIRRIAGSLISVESANVAKATSQREAAFQALLSTTLKANAGLFALAACLFLVIRRDCRMLEEEAARRNRELASRDLQLNRLTSALSGEARSEITAMNTTSRLLLENYGGFLPRQGHEYAEQMKEAAMQIERLRQDLVGSLACEGNEHAA